MNALPPAPGTPIHNIGEIARFSATTAEHARAALNIDGGLYIDAHSSSDSLSLSMRLPAKLLSFQICSCWKRRENNIWGGMVKGCYWVCSAIPIDYIKEWKGLDEHGAVINPDSFWEKVHIGPNDPLPEIWWLAPSSECCCDSSSREAEFSCPPSSGEANCDQHDNWQAAVHPKFGINDIVWCTLEYSSGFWMVVDAFENIVPFQLKEPLKGCHGSALAWLIGWKCEDTGCCSQSSSEEFGPCGQGCPPSSSDHGESSCERKGKVALKAATARIHDPLGIVNVQFQEHQIAACIIDKLQCQVECDMNQAARLAIDSVPKPTHYGSSSCDEPGSHGWNHYLCLYIKTFMAFSLKLYSSSIAKVINHANSARTKACTAPKDTNGWAKWNPAKRRLEVISYGNCFCNECPTPSSECENIPGLCETSASCEASASDCVLLPGSEEGGFGKKCKGEGVTVPKKVTFNKTTCQIEVEYCELEISCGCLKWKDDCSSTSGNPPVLLDANAIGPNGLELFGSSTDG